MSNLLNALNEQTSNGTNQTTPADSGNISAEKTWFSDVSVKGLISLKEVQEAIRRYVNLPTGPLIVKKAKKPYENKDTKDKTQKIEVLSGTDVYVRRHFKWSSDCAVATN